MEDGEVLLFIHHENLSPCISLSMSQAVKQDLVSILQCGMLQVDLK